MALPANAVPCADAQIPAALRSQKRGRPAISSEVKEARIAAQLRESVARFGVAPDGSYVRAPVVCAIAGISKATLWRWVKNQTWPAPKKLSDRVSAWLVSDVRAALAAAAA